MAASQITPFHASDLAFTPQPADFVPEAGKEAHGRYMLLVSWDRSKGWADPQIVPRGPIGVDPLSGVFQYSVTCFEGMKCYKTEQGDVTLFRPNDNFERFKTSAARMGLPSDFDNQALLDLLCKLLALETPMVPSEDGSSLYIRPTIIETSEAYGIKEDGYASSALMYIVTVLNLGKGLYHSAEKPELGLRLDACKDYIRAWPGGTGKYKIGANYGIVNIAKQKGYHMSLWLHGKEDFISEAGAMNVFIIKQAPDGFLEFITMSLDNGIVLPGLTRQSLITLLTEHASGTREFPLPGMPRNVRVVQRDISMGEIIESIADGTLKGMFGCGTGVVIVSIRDIQYHGQVYQVPFNPLCLLLRDTITGMQRGRIERPEWVVKVPKWSGATNGHAH